MRQDYSMPSFNILDEMDAEAEAAGESVRSEKSPQFDPIK